LERKKTHPALDPQHPNETRTRPEQVPNKFRPSPAAKTAKKHENEQNPNETRTSPEQVPNKSGPLKHCKHTMHQFLLARATSFAKKCHCEGLRISHERKRAESIGFQWKNTKNHPNNVFQKTTV
jgi:hypothetical protein